MENYDRLCVESWIASGLRILAINTPEEIPHLAARYSGVEFVPVARTAEALFRRNTPFIADMMSVLAAQSEPVLGIVNCDLLFEPLPAWESLETFVSRKTVVTGQRLDVRTLSGGALHYYLPGFDYFFFDHAAADALAKSTLPFSMGLPWWDYWCPLHLALHGYELRNVTHPAVLHLAHESRTNAHTATWRWLAVEFARSMVLESDRAASAPAGWEKLIAHCHVLGEATEAEINIGARDEEIIRLSELCVPIIGGTSIRLGDASSLPARDTSMPKAFFADIPNRITAGRALHQALWEENQNRLDAAHTLYRVALENAPQDPGVLSNCGNFLFRRGDMDRAAILLGKAVELAPDSAWLLNCLGSALGQLGRDDEAIACFERALAADPLDGASYYNLAVALQPARRHGEIVRRLEAKLRDTPDFPNGLIWLGRIREAMPAEG